MKRFTRRWSNKASDGLPCPSVNMSGDHKADYFRDGLIKYLLIGFLAAPKMTDVSS
jgi:hypothetical protein